uniref:Rho GTPase activating protein 10 n=1 Tax=Callorhinchus milii TaxID=7868 RepID=A0A4W3HUW0_CALMI
MGLQPLEFSHCYLDSPTFRERLKILWTGKSFISRKFSHSLAEFSFEFIGDAETDDERSIDESLQEFAAFLRNLEDQRELMALNIREAFIKPLDKFRKEQLGAAKEEKKKYEKETDKYYSGLEKYVGLSAKKKDAQLSERDTHLEHVRQNYHEMSLEYVCKLQEIQERKKFEFVEPMLSFFQMLFTFYHHGYELAKDFNHYKTELHLNIQNARNRFDGARSEVEELMQKIKKNPQEHMRMSSSVMEGYLYLQEKRAVPFGSTWVKHYCSYRKETKKFTMVPFDQKAGGKIGEEDEFTLQSCTRKKSDTVEKRFCFDIEAVDRQGVFTMQAVTEGDRKLWMEAMDGTEPVYLINKTDLRREGYAQLDSMGFNIIKKCIHAIETRGLNDQGLYRVAGVSSKVQRLVNLLMDPKTCDDLDLSSSPEWEVKTITSALKQYLRSLPEPLMTHKLFGEFILPASSSPCFQLSPTPSFPGAIELRDWDLPQNILTFQICSLGNTVYRKVSKWK